MSTYLLTSTVLNFPGGTEVKPCLGVEFDVKNNLLHEHTMYGSVAFRKGKTNRNNKCFVAFIIMRICPWYSQIAEYQVIKNHLKLPSRLV